MERHLHGVLYVFIITFSLIHFVQTQDQKGFITLDCGLSPDGSPYTDPSTGLTFTSDASFVESGKNGRVDKDSERNFEKAFVTLRYFPEGQRNCYNVETTQGTKYLIRASFFYGNYDGLQTLPNFDLFLGPNKWTTVNLNATVPGGQYREIIHMSKLSSLQICLVKTGTTTPMISTLELRPLRSDIYISDTGSSLQFLSRTYLKGSGSILRYPDDVYDRRWFPLVKKDWNLITTTLNVNTSNGFDPPQGAMASAATYVNDNGTWDIPWNMEDSTTRFHIYLHFAEIQTLLANETREFSVLLNGNEFSKPFSPKMLGIVTMITQPESTLRCESGACLLQLVKTTKSTLPPLLNAMEIFTVVELPQPETNQDEVVAINKIQSAYGLSRVSWQGDPCVPREFLWAGLNCNNTDTSTPPTITSLNLSSSGLTDIIMPAIQNLTNLQELDLSNNSLNGDVPEFLADMKSLFIINLSGNNLSGQVPQKLLQKKGLNFEGNPNLNCTESSCVNKPRESGHPKKSIIVPVVASVASMVIIGSALVTFFVLKRKKTSNNRGIHNKFINFHGRRTPRPEPPKITKKKRFSYAEVTEMTNNFERILGRGGFGMVYHGYVNGTEQVAVKVVSQGSDQGHKQFKAEVDLLLRVHHKNLVGLVGYCEKGKDLVLVYEYMSNGDLKEVLSGKHHSSVLRWGTRLKIAVDAAQGLEYLYKGCRPPIVHRDVKTANILLDEHFQAKIADFGLSKSFPNDGESHVSTVVAGTLGYLDPEYYNTNWLTEKSDVYSFGVVLLEIITNLPLIDQRRETPYIAEWVGLMVTKGDIKSIIDPRLKDDYHSDSVWKFVELAMACVNFSSASRPTMSQVVIELIECLTLENSRGGTSCDMESRGSREVTMTFGTEVNPTAR
ncbi:PREDICTED: probable LRR receptor-like serine/threonine-protein kinase At1g51820 isoform X3 [Brassica oleracea var. oleracea]|uniref:probable LRR receptor-like serine/threonine-protein kinase At1g51820 isoform X3 n=1 Tax=Brassica oleracea var. oleracea TaxID=109376 RepID=UPI0006A70ADE|nr:PREDICTED: probable LRR receptor-like serine/threonine-protein kinase At1g51820 isoform X3 [Brassica oleracea var. oleracea]